MCGADDCATCHPLTWWHGDDEKPATDDDDIDIQDDEPVATDELI